VYITPSSSTTTLGLKKIKFKKLENKVLRAGIQLLPLQCNIHGRESFLIYSIVHKTKSVTTISIHCSSGKIDRYECDLSLSIGIEI
jgi:hypothetical protein